MQIDKKEALGHLTYCTNIHAGADWPDMIAGLRRWVPHIKSIVAPDARFGLGLRIAASAAESLTQKGKLSELQEFLDVTGCYVFTINGFPYGPFHGQPVKERVYAPDWRTQERLAYTNALADILVRLLPDDIDGSISTVPGSFKAWSVGHEDRIADGMIDHVAHLVAIHRSSGRMIRLAIEPEPCCMLETIEETVSFFKDRIFSARAAARLSDVCGFSRSDAEVALRDHVGVCYDVCHAAVEYEDPAQSIAALQAAGITIPKLQLSSALRIPSVGVGTATAIAPFDEPVYLHQVVARDLTNPGQPLRRFVDLPEALAVIDESIGKEWRVHFHVPLFINELNDFGTTQFFLREILEIHGQNPISSHLEVETYTWDVLPDLYRGVDVATAIGRELQWVLGHLKSGGTDR